MNYNLCMALTGMLGLLAVVFGLMELMPQGMWLYLGAVVWGSVTLTIALLGLRVGESAGGE